VRLIAVPYGRFEVEALAPLPEGAWIGIFNHASVADVPALAWAMDGPVGFWAKAELGHRPLLGRWLRACGAVFVRRGQQDEAAFREALGRVRAGQPFVLAPEGTRRHGESQARVHTGFVRLALEGGCPVVPFAIAGALRVLPPDARLPRWGRPRARARWGRPRVRVRRGAPIWLPERPVDEEHRDELVALAGELMAAIYRTRDELEGLER
jgi:1-acyl-sn-glycerol-3-phosphate acyltransferase